MVFSILIHPIDETYFARIGSTPEQEEPGVIKEVLVGEEKGTIIGVPLTAEQLMDRKNPIVLEQILKALELAKQNNADIASLTAFLANATRQGADLVGQERSKKIKKVMNGIAITTGRAYTIATVYQQAKHYLMRSDKVAVIGARGTIGRWLGCLLGGEYNAELITRKDGIQKAYDSDIIISCTSSTKKVLDAKLLKKGAVVIDAAVPADLSNDSGRKDITIIPGGIVCPPHEIDFGFDYDLRSGQLYACMAEAIILSIERRHENFSVGYGLDLQKIREIDTLAKRNGFKTVLEN